MPASEFAGPNRTYPVNDKSHAANAKARATQAVKAGRMSEKTEEKIEAKANKVLHHGKAHEKEAHHSGKALHHSGEAGGAMFGRPGSHLTEHGMQGHHPSDKGEGHKNVKNPESHKQKLRES